MRPYGVVIDGHLELGLEVMLVDGAIADIVPHRGVPEPFVLSAAFVNAHSHLEYRNFQDAIDEAEYWPWIRELTRRKQVEYAEDVARACQRGAEENAATGVAWIGEHTDRPGSAQAMVAHGIGGTLFQEVITFAERETRHEKLAKVEERRRSNAANGLPTYLNPHAYQTVDEETLSELAATGSPASIHVAETEAENELTRDGRGVLAAFRRSAGFEALPTGESVAARLMRLGYARPGVQFVHCCAVDDADITRMAEAGLTAAHCPRSNARLGCPIAPVRRMREAGVLVGLGMDSPASSGRIDFFDEMRAALASSRERGEPLGAEDVWRMATDEGYRSFGLAEGRWTVEIGARTPLIAIHVEGARTVEELIEFGAPERVERV